MSAPAARRDPATLLPFRSPLHDERAAAILGTALGVLLLACFVTGVLSHLVQDPGGWFAWPSRPAGLYRVTQGVHVVAGIASIPLLLVKLWVVYPKLFTWPPVTSAAHAVERLALLPLIGGALLLVVTGLGNINLYRPWSFSFRNGHHAAAWLVVGALIVHVSAKWATARSHLVPGRVNERAVADAAIERDRRWFLTSAFAASVGAAALVAGQTYRPLRRLALLAPRRPDAGPQGFPVNRTARSVGLTGVSLDTWRLEVHGLETGERVVLTHEDLLGLEQHEATLPIACVEGWSTSQRWRGVRLRDLSALVGVDRAAEVTVISMQRSSRQQRTTLGTAHAHDPDSLVALAVNDETLHPDHGFPARLIAPNLPGVHQIKWLARIEVV